MTFNRDAGASLGSSLFDMTASDLTPDLAPANGGLRSDQAATRILTALCMLAASPATIAVAQEGNKAAEPADLPPLVVETTQKKKKSAAAKKSAAPVSPLPQAPAPQQQVTDRPQTPPLLRILLSGFTYDYAGREHSLGDGVSYTAWRFNIPM